MPWWSTFSPLTVVERETGAEELVRVAKRDAPLFVSVIDRLGVLRTILLEFREARAHLAGLESLSSHLKEATKNLYKDKWKMWMDIIIKICNRPWVLGTAEHILYVGRSQTRFLKI